LQSDPENFTYPSVFHTLEDVKSGDYFFLCSDGVYEYVTDVMLQNILNSNDSDTQKLSKIKENAVPNAKDNCTAYLIHVAGVEGNVSAANAQLIDSEKRTFSKTTEVHTENHYVEDAVMGEVMIADYDHHLPAFAPIVTNNPQVSAPKEDYKQYYMPALLLSVLAIAGLLIAYLFNSDKPKPVETPFVTSVPRTEPKQSERNRPTAAAPIPATPTAKGTITTAPVPTPEPNITLFKNEGPPEKAIKEAAQNLQSPTPAGTLKRATESIKEFGKSKTNEPKSGQNSESNSNPSGEQKQNQTGETKPNTNGGNSTILDSDDRPTKKEVKAKDKTDLKPIVKPDPIVPPEVPKKKETTTTPDQ
jgi:hypothetical protein